MLDTAFRRVDIALTEFTLISRRDRTDDRIGGIGTFSGRAPLAPGGLPGFTGPFPSTSLDKGVCGC